MVGFRSDNPTGSAWVSSGRALRLPRRSEGLESQFLAGNYAKADRRRQRRLARSQREHFENQPRTWTAPRTGAAPPQSTTSQTPRSYEVTRRPTPPGSTTTVGRLHGVTVPSDQSFMARATRIWKNFAHARLTSATATFTGSAGYTLDGVELTKQELSAWLGGDPRANNLVVIDGGRRTDTGQSPNIRPVVQTVSAPSDSPRPSQAVQTRRRSQQPARRPNNAPQRAANRPRPQARPKKSNSVLPKGMIFWIVLFLIMFGGGIIADVIRMITEIL